MYVLLMEALFIVVSYFTVEPVMPPTTRSSAKAKPAPVAKPVAGEFSSL